LPPEPQEVINTPEDMPHSNADLQEAATRHGDALAVIRPITDALHHVPTLCAEVRQLRHRLASTVLDLSDLIAAALATLGAYAEGEPDPLYYLRDQLHALGYLPNDPGQPHSHSLWEERP
jgi:hypothetical protein